MVSFAGLRDRLAILPYFAPILIPLDLHVIRMIRVIRLLPVFKRNRPRPRNSVRTAANPCPDVIDAGAQRQTNQPDSSGSVVVSVGAPTARRRFNFTNRKSSET